MQLQIMYGVAGERDLDERLLPWLRCFDGSQPVRVGNHAHVQVQLDVIGEIMDAFHLARRRGMAWYRHARGTSHPVPAIS